MHVVVLSEGRGGFRNRQRSPHSRSTCRCLSLLVAYDVGAHEAFRATATAVARRHWWSLRRDHLDGSIRASALWGRFSDDAKGQCWRSLIFFHRVNHRLLHSIRSASAIIAREESIMPLVSSILLMHARGLTRSEPSLENDRQLSYCIQLFQLSSYPAINLSSSHACPACPASPALSCPLPPPRHTRFGLARAAYSCQLQAASGDQPALGASSKSASPPRVL